MTDEQEYCAHVAALFTAPFLTEDELLTNLTRYWPGDAAETLQGLLELGFIDRSPTGRYRLPLPEWTPATDLAKLASLPSPVVAQTPVKAAASLPPVSAPITAQTVPLSTSPALKPLRLARPAIAA